MELRTWTCDIKRCKTRETEKDFNSGFPGWGCLAGLYNPETGADKAFICPSCMNQIRLHLEGGL